MSLEEALEKNTAALARLADLIEHNRGYLANHPVGAAVEKAVEHAIEHAAPAIAEAVADKVDGKPDDDKPRIMIGGTDMVLGPDETIPEFTWEGVTKQFRKYAQKNGKDAAIKLAGEFDLKIPLNRDELKPEMYEEFYHACSN